MTLASLTAIAFTLGILLGRWHITDKARHVLAIESFVRACRDATVRRQIREWVLEVPEVRSIARVDRVRVRGGLPGRRVA
jgi:hypothetical protein